MKPVVKPLIIEFQGSSFPRMRANVQSAVVNIRPHMEKLPANKNLKQYSENHSHCGIKQSTLNSWNSLLFSVNFAIPIK